MCYVVRDFKAPEVQNVDYFYLKKKNYFEKPCRRKVAQNNVVNNMLPLNYWILAPVRSLRVGH